MKTRLLAALAATTLSGLVSAPQANAHCQVPCGLYDDQGVMNALHLDWQTIAKAVKEINELSKDPSKNANQIARWVANKESHATNIQNVVGAYFLAQRLKVDEAKSDKEAYLKKLTLCHQVIVAAMKCKQSSDAAAVENLHNLMHEFASAFKLKAG